MKLLVRSFCSLFLVTAFISPVLANEDARLFLLGKQASRQKNYDFAFMHFNSILRQYEESNYAEKALFAKGEYYFKNENFKTAKKTFGKFIEAYPQSEARDFAFMYLYAIANHDQNADLENKYRYELVSSKQLSFTFRDYQEFIHTSALNHKLLLRYYIDKIDFLIDGERVAGLAY